MGISSRFGAVVLVIASTAGFVAPASGQDGTPAPAAADASPESPSPRGECAPPLPEPTPVAVEGDGADGEQPTEPPPAPVEVVRPPELAFVNGRCIPIAELNRLLAGYEGAAAEEAAALVELREHLNLVEQLNRALDDTELAIAKVVVQGAAAEAETRYAAMRESIANQELVAVQTELATQEQILRDQAVATYVSGGESSIALAGAVLAAEDLNAIAATRIYGRVIVDGQLDQIDLVEALETAANELEVDLGEARRHTIEVAANVASVQQTALVLHLQVGRLVLEAKASSEVQAALVASIQNRRDEFAGQLGFASGSSGSLNSVLATLSGGSGSLADVGVLSSPLAIATVSSGFGPRLHPIFAEVRIHTGLDMTAAAGEPILAVADGTVVVAGDEGGYGNAIAIDHGDGIATLYAHQSAFAVGVGDDVIAGQVIGFVGSTGFSTGPHLHFELRIDGSPIDPLPFVDFQPGSQPIGSASQTGG